VSQTLLNHSTAKVREYHQIGSFIGDLLQGGLVKLAEEEGLVVETLSLQGRADYAGRREPVGINMRYNQHVLSPSYHLCRLLAQLLKLGKLLQNLLAL